MLPPIDCYKDIDDDDMKLKAIEYQGLPYKNSIESA